MCRTDLTSTLTKQSAKLMHPVNPLSGNAHIYYFTLPTNGQMILPIKGEHCHSMAYSSHSDVFCCFLGRAKPPHFYSPSFVQTRKIYRVNHSFFTTATASKYSINQIVTTPSHIKK